MAEHNAVKRTDALQGDIIHEYDGIEEADNSLPMWWVTVFIFTMGFAVVYWLMVQTFHLTPSPAEALVVAEAKRAAETGTVAESELLAAAQDTAKVAAGKQAYVTNCVACHGVKAEGNIGPNLTDKNWLHGGAAGQIFTTIRDGVPAKGMPTWGPVLGPAAVRDLTAYVLTLRNTLVPGGKPPQGELYTGL